MSSIQSMARDAISLYDHNRDGSIDLTRRGRHDETLRQEQGMRRVGGRDGDTFEITKEFSHRKLFEAADADKNGQVTQQEVEGVMRSFDKDNDGKLESRGFFGWLFGKAKLDGDRFDDQFAEEFRGSRF